MKIRRKNKKFTRSTSREKKQKKREFDGASFGKVRLPTLKKVKCAEKKGRLLKTMYMNLVSAEKLDERE